jgi:hypothetical protein
MADEPTGVTVEIHGKFAVCWDNEDFDGDVPPDKALHIMARNKVFQEYITQEGITWFAVSGISVRRE